MWLNDLIEKSAEIIQAAAASPLGVVSLAAILFSVLAFFWFRKSSEQIRIGIFVLLFIGVLLFTFSTGRESGVKEVNSSPSQESSASNSETAITSVIPPVSEPSSTDSTSTTQVPQNPNSAKEYFENGVLALDGGGIPQAIKEFSDSVKQDSSYADAHFFLAYSLYKNGQCGQAIESLNMAISNENVYTLDTQPNYPRSSINLIKTLAHYYRAGIKYIYGNEQEASNDLTLATRSYRKLNQFENRFLSNFVAFDAFSSSNLGLALREFNPVLSQCR